jgi:hypothetical protein
MFQAHLAIIRGMQTRRQEESEEAEDMTEGQYGNR